MWSVGKPLLGGHLGDGTTGDQPTKLEEASQPTDIFKVDEADGWDFDFKFSIQIFPLRDT